MRLARLHIAFYLGIEFALRPDSPCLIVSNDAGFDPLMRHCHARGQPFRRVSSLEQAFPEPQAKCVTDPFARLLTLLRKERARPTRLKGLSGKVKSWFPLSGDERSALVQRLLSEGYVRFFGQQSRVPALKRSKREVTWWRAYGE